MSVQCANRLERDNPPFVSVFNQLPGKSAHIRADVQDQIDLLGSKASRESRLG
jgi:hypothetical protein